MDRNKSLAEIRNGLTTWDVAVIGGGSSGLGAALDALSRGLKVILVERADFAKGTSSRSTKLLHGGVRYLAQGNIGLVLEALKERGLLMNNAPHVTRKQAFVIPIYTLFDKVKYSLGLKAYDMMAGSLRLGKSEWIPKEEVIQRLPSIKQEGLKGGVLYYDGQFDDARLALNIAQTCFDMGGCMINYMQVSSLSKDNQGIVDGINVTDQLSTESFKVKAKVVVNATGVFTDAILQMDVPGANASVVSSQGAHLVLDLSFLGGSNALMIPNTPDGRVLFGIPWHGKLVLGTTDTVSDTLHHEPKALEEEINFILETSAAYLTRPPTRNDVLAAFAGLRPLAAPQSNSTQTKEISRSHKVSIATSHLVSVIGGKWTTFRKMGQDTIAAIARLKGWKLPPSTSSTIKLHGYAAHSTTDGHLGIYGSDAAGIKALIAQNPELGITLHSRYPYTRAEVVWIVHNEMALKLEDVLSRRLRILMLDARAAAEMAPEVASIMRRELDLPPEWENTEVSSFLQLAQAYLIST